MFNFKIPENLEGYDYFPLVFDLPGDWETPVSLISKVKNEEYFFLLESAEGGEKIGRYSFLSWRPKKIFSFPYNYSNDILSELSLQFPPSRIYQEKELPRFLGGIVGFISYDLIRQWEKLPDSTEDNLSFPLASFQLTDFLIVFDHLKRKISIILLISKNELKNKDVLREYREKIREILDIFNRSPQRSNPYNLTFPLESFTSENEYKEMVKKALEYIREGEIFQVVLSQRFHTRYPLDPYLLYRALRFINPSPYMFFLRFKDIYLIGASPEALVRVEKGKGEVRPIAGTRPRGNDPLEDELLEKELINNEKERAEHIMLLDLGRNDLGRVAEIGSVKVEELMKIEKYSHVMHLVSTVSCKVKENIHPLEVLRACFPAGTVSGAPKIRAMEIIEELEKFKRGPYAGGIGYLSFDGNLDTCITIRSFFLKGEDLYLQVGAGIVYDSDPKKEYEETINKAKALFEAIKISGGLDYAFTY
ncbi:MAG: anthranilate synthase component I family protein [Dictyoglomus sp.]|nr:anthranilate synthase component I family protein [Dictyoglomus sp.]MCX7942080.1 anthranilate synthase component I family protein [Dictyoglomaceae bacterium]MDW8187927.1 anthranilate synthase component I family protein [Dictyoglomus sp.]